MVQAHLEDPREALDRLIAERGEDYTSLSRMVGRNAAYIQQFIKRGSPRRLGERERGILASYFRVEEALLGGPRRDGVGRAGGLFTVPRLDIGAAAGAGGLGEDDRTEGLLAFDERWLRQLSASPGQLSLIRVEGDSMAPTLAHGDDIMVDGGDAGDRLRDGIYVLRRDGVLLVKRILCAGGRGTIAIVSDNPAYPTDEGVDPAGVDIVGRVLWTGRRL